MDLMVLGGQKNAGGRSSHRILPPDLSVLLIPNIFRANRSSSRRVYS